jgi:hypothetical protein
MRQYYMSFLAIGVLAFFWFNTRNDLALESYIELMPDIRTQEPLDLGLSTCLVKWRNHDRARNLTPVATEAIKALNIANTSTCPMAIVDPSSYSAFHIPHFCEKFFMFVSALLWEEDIFGVKNCVRYMQIPLSGDSAEFWSDYTSGADTWVMQMVHTVSETLGDFVVSDDFSKKYDVPVVDHRGLTTQHGGNWFLHPSDAVWLASTVLSLNPCADYGTHTQLLNRSLPTRVRVLQRPHGRTILNVDVVESVVMSRLHNQSRVVDYRVLQTETTSMLTQAELFYNADILISVHGAGETNMAFMKPCSVVIEFCMFGYCEPGASHYFGDLAISAGLLYYRYTESPENMQIESFIVGGHWYLGTGQDCVDLLADLPKDKHEAYGVCMRDGNCRRCARLCNVNVNATVLDGLLTRAMTEREECILNHPLYQ